MPHSVLLSWMIGGLVAWPLDVRPWLRRRQFQAAALAVTALMGAGVGVTMFAAVTRDLPDVVQRIGLDGGLAGALEQTSRAWRNARNPFQAVRDTEPPPPQDSLVTLAVFIAECTRPRDRVFLTAYIPQVLGLAQRRFAGGLPPSPNHGLRAETQQWAVERLSGQTVPIAILDGTFAADFPILAAYFDKYYQPAGERVFDQRFNLRLLVHRGAPVVRTFKPLGWPCLA